MLRSTRYVLGLALALSAAACAGTNQEAVSPEAEQASFGETSAPSRARTTGLPQPVQTVPDSLVQNQQAKQVPQPLKDPAKDPDAETTADSAQALQVKEEAKADAEQNAREQAKWAKLGREQDRKNTEEYARERLGKANARVNAAMNQSARIQGKRRLKLNTDKSEFDTKRVDVQQRIESLPATGSDEWRITKEALDEALNDLDGLSYRVEGDL